MEIDHFLQYEERVIVCWYYSMYSYSFLYIMDGKADPYQPSLT